MDRLLILQQSITNRIEQAKNQIHPTPNKAFIDSVLIEIETLNWVLNEISQYSIDCGVKQSDIVRVSRTLHGYDDIKDIVKRALRAL
jgi:hypothetical protein